MITVFIPAPSLRAAEDPNRPISINLIQADIEMVLRLLMEASGANIILQGGISGPVTCQVKDLPLEQFLDVLTKANGLAWHKENGVYIITRQNAQASAAVMPALDAGPPPPPAMAATGPIVLDAPRSTASQSRAQLRWDKIALRNMDPRTAAYLFGQAGDPGLELMASRMRDAGFGNQNAFSNFNNQARQNVVTGTDSGSLANLYDMSVGPGFSRSRFPGRTGGPGGNIFQQAPADGMPGGGGGGADAGGNQNGETLLPDGITQIVPYDIDNSLLVRGTPEAIAELKDLIKMLDLPPKQVRIEAEFLSVNVNDQQRLGFNWSITDGETDINAQLPSGGDLNIRFARGNFSAALQALKSVSNGRTIIAPRVTTMNNVPAAIGTNTSIPFVQNTVSATAGGQVITTPQLGSFNVTIQLMVTPRINGDNSVTMMLSPTVSDITGYTEVAGQSLPIIQEQQIMLPAIRVKDGETLVIGGLVRRQDSVSTRKLPFFSDLPLIGNLFRSNSRDQNDLELLIFLTPKVLPNDEATEALAPAIGTVAPLPRPIGAP